MVGCKSGGPWGARGAAVTAQVHFEVLVDRRERPQKCTILPLAELGHPALRVVRFAASGELPALSGDFLLHPDGEPLLARPAGAEAALQPQRAPWTVSAIDATWRRLSPILGRVARPLPRLVRIPDGFVTAYPRRNQQNQDPDQGLATIEALFIAAAYLGQWDESLLQCYHWRENFLAANHRRFMELGLCPKVAAPEDARL